MNFKVSTSKEALGASGSGSKYINKSGIYPVTIQFASLAVTSGGAESVNFNIDHEGNTQTLWGPYVTNKDGNDNKIGMALINQLAVVAGMDEGDEPELVQETHPVGKDQKEQEFTVITNFSELPVYVRVQEEYSMYNGEIKDSLVIKSFFRADRASADEIVNESEIGKRFKLEEEKYASNVTYKDGLTPEMVAEWKANGYGKKEGNKTPAPKAAAKPSKASLFK